MFTKRRRISFCGQELRLRGDAADGAVAAAKLDGWKVAMAQAISTQEPGLPEDHKHTSAGVAVAVRSNRVIGLPLGIESRDASPGGHGGRVALAWADCCGGFVMASVCLQGFAGSQALSLLATGEFQAFGGLCLILVAREAG